MNTLQINSNGTTHKLNFPSSWEEFTAKQLRYIAQRFLTWGKTNQQFLESIKLNTAPFTIALDETIQTERINLLLALLNLPKWPFRKEKKALFSLTADELKDVLQELTFVFEEIKPFNCPLPTFKHKSKTYHAPAESLQNITGSEFHFLEMCYSEACAQKTESLNLLVAILYRQKGNGPEHTEKSQAFVGDVRTPFNRFAADKNAELLATLPHETKMLVLLWYTSCRNAIIKNHPHVFKTSSAKSETEETENNGWMSVFRNLAKNPLDFDDIANKNLSYLLWELTNLHFEAEEAKRQKAS